MPKFKRDVSKAEARTPVGVYDGPAVPDGTYAGILKFIKYRVAGTGTEYWNTLTTLDAKNKEGQHAEYDGFAVWTKFYLDGSDFSQTKELGLYTAVCGRGDVDVITDDKVQGDPIVTKVGGVSPSGVRVYVELKTEEYQGEWRQAGFMIYPDLEAQKDGKKVPAATSSEPDEEPDGEVDVEAEEKPKRTRKAPAKKAAPSNVTPIKQAEAEPDGEDVDYHSMSIVQLRTAAKEAGIETKGVNKSDLIDALTDKAGDADSNGKKTPEDILNMSDEELADFAEESGYGREDFAELSREDSVTVLREDGVITTF